MDLMVERRAGVDIGKDEVVACVRTPPDRQGPPQADPDVQFVHLAARGDG